MKGPALISLLLFASISLAWIPASVGASTVNFRIDKLQATVWINEDSSIDLYYHAEITCESGTLSTLAMDLQGKEFILGEAVDDLGKEIDVFLDRSGLPVLKFSKPIPQGSSLGFNFTANVREMIYLEAGSPERAVMSFKPTTWNASVTAIQVLVVLPDGAEEEDVVASPNFNHTQAEEESGRLMIVWEGTVKHDESYALKISYPNELQPERVTARSGWEAFVDQYLWPNRLTILTALILILAIIPFTRDIKRRFSNR